MPLINELKWFQAANLMACTWLLSSCGGSDGVSVTSAIPAYAYVATPGTLTTYSIDPSTGDLTDLGGSPLTFPVSFPFGGISQIATDPSGQVLYLLHSSGVHAYAISRNTGALTTLAGSPFDSGSVPTSLAFDAFGTHLYVAGYSGPAAPFTL